MGSQYIKLIPKESQIQLLSISEHLPIFLSQEEGGGGGVLRDTYFNYFAHICNLKMTFDSG